MAKRIEHHVKKGDPSHSRDVLASIVIVPVTPLSRAGGLWGLGWGNGGGGIDEG